MSEDRSKICDHGAFLTDGRTLSDLKLAAVLKTLADELKKRPGALNSRNLIEVITAALTKHFSEHFSERK